MRQIVRAETFSSDSQIQYIAPQVYSHYNDTDLRNELMYTINYPVTIDVKLLLKGSDTLSVDQNVDIFIKVQNFILKSKRFTS